MSASTINSINLLDGADGFAATIGIVMTCALGVMAFYQGKMVDAVIAMALAGALVGFLRYNFPPAKAYREATDAVYRSGAASSADFLDVYEQLVENGILSWDEIESFGEPVAR